MIKNDFVDEVIKFCQMCAKHTGKPGIEEIWVQRWLYDQMSHEITQEAYLRYPGYLNADWQNGLITIVGPAGDVLVRRAR